MPPLGIVDIRNPGTGREEYDEIENVHIRSVIGNPEEGNNLFGAGSSPGSDGQVRLTGYGPARPIWAGGQAQPSGCPSPCPGPSPDPGPGNPSEKFGSETQETNSNKDPMSIKNYSLAMGW